MSIGEISAYILAGALCLLLLGVFFKPLKGIFVMIFQSLLGGIGLFLCNFILTPIGLSLGINAVTAAVCGLLGLPGLILLLLVKGIFTYM